MKELEENTTGSVVASHSASDGNSNSEVISRTMPHGSFAGMPYFNMSKSAFNNVAFVKQKNKHWKTYIGKNEDDSMMPIRNYARQNPKKPILGRFENSFFRLQ